jgi:hypothetical protein
MRRIACTGIAIMATCNKSIHSRGSRNVVLLYFHFLVIYTVQCKRGKLVVLKNAVACLWSMNQRHSEMLLLEADLS